MAVRLESSLSNIASEFPDKTAVSLHRGDSLSFSRLDELSSRLASFLVKSGVRPADRVAVCAGHDLRAIALFWATLKAGAISVWLNDDAGEEALRRVVESSSPVLIYVSDDRRLRKLEAATDNERILPIPEISQIDEQEPVSAVCSPDSADDVAALVYTSGSSGKPKGVSLTHRNLATVAFSVIEHMPIESTDSYLMVVPLHYVHGLMQLLVHALAGCTVYFQESFLFPKKVVDAIKETEVTGFSGVPYHFNALITRGALLNADLPHLRWMTVTGGALATSTILEILEAFSEKEFHIAYGQTECAPRATALHPSKTLNKPDSIGQAIPGVIVHIVDESGNEVPNGDVGELVVEGENVMLGYWNDQAGTEEVLDDKGRLHTGDLARRDEGGDIFLVGRKSAMIKMAGERIIPEELETIIGENSLVSEVVVVGAADELLGQRVEAHLIINGELDDDLEKTILEFCLMRVPAARAPKAVKVWQDFPRKANGKPDRARILEGIDNK